MLIAELEAHQVKADKGYIHRAICITQSASDFRATILPPQLVTCFPPPAPPVEPHLYPDAMDFVQMDMEGGQRTPKIKAGPQYYLRTLPSLPLYICSATPRGTVAMWWNETIANRGADEMISCQYLYDTTRATGAGTKRLWVNGTASQSWNRKFWLYLLDCTNPESPIFHPDDPITALYKRIGRYCLFLFIAYKRTILLALHFFLYCFLVLLQCYHLVLLDIYRNPPGHNFMEPDRQHGVVVRHGNRQSQICAQCKPADPMDSIFMDRLYFRHWGKYLSQMYRKNPRSSKGEKYFNYYWANFGWGTSATGHLILRKPRREATRVLN
jgi:hypothetical protein